MVYLCAIKTEYKASIYIRFHVMWKAKLALFVLHGSCERLSTTYTAMKTNVAFIFIFLLIALGMLSTSTFRWEQRKI